MKDHASDPPLTIDQLCGRLNLPRSTFYKHRANLERAGVLVEALPRIGTRPRYLAGPIENYLSGESRRAVVRQALGRSV